MAPCVILIGFAYSQNMFLPSSIIDLYRMYTFYKSRGVEEIHLLTDIREDPSVEMYKSIIVKGEVDANLLGFITEMQKDKYHPIKSKEELTNTLVGLIKENKTQEWSIYITGHGEKRGFLLPRGEVIQWLILQKIILNTLPNEATCLLILDACHGFSFSLPYTLKGDKTEIIDDPTFFPRPKIILIASQGTQAASTLSGSLVTRTLSRLLGEKVANLKELSTKIKSTLRETETLRQMNLGVGVYASRHDVMHLWKWITGSKRRRRIYPSSQGVFLAI